MVTRVSNLGGSGSGGRLHSISNRKEFGGLLAEFEEEDGDEDEGFIMAMTGMMEGG